MLSRIILKLFRLSKIYESLRPALIRDLRRPLTERIEPSLLKQTRRELQTEFAASKEVLRDEIDRRHEKLKVRLRRNEERAETRLRSIDERTEDLSDQQGAMARRLMALERLIALNDEYGGELSVAPDWLSARRVIDHVARQIAAAEVLTDPFPHIFVENLFPDDVYELLVDSIPALEFFPERDPIKRNFLPSQPLAPMKSKVVWRYFDATFCRQTLLPALMAKFAPFLEQHYADIFGEEFVDRACALPQVNSGGRLMCRRPGYHLRPHLDPKRVFLTALFYLPRTRDEDEQFGTQIYRGDRPFAARYLNTYYPERDAVNFKLVKTIPFRWNSLTVFMNSGAAHGAEIPHNAAPPNLERYAYQVYIGPELSALEALIEDLPEDRRVAWRQRSAKRPEWGNEAWHGNEIRLVE